MKTLNFKGFKKVKDITTIGAWNSELGNGNQAIAIDGVNKTVVIKCSCNNCSDVSRITLTKAQIKKINTILNTK